MNKERCVKLFCDLCSDYGVYDDENDKIVLNEIYTKGKHEIHFNSTPAELKWGDNNTFGIDAYSTVTDNDITIHIVNCDAVINDEFVFRIMKKIFDLSLSCGDLVEYDLTEYPDPGFCDCDDCNNCDECDCCDGECEDASGPPRNIN